MFGIVDEFVGGVMLGVIFFDSCGIEMFGGDDGFGSVGLGFVILGDYV